MKTGYSTINEIGTKRLDIMSVLVALLFIGMPLHSYADATAPCNVGTGAGSTECGVNSNTGTATFATALGNDARATMSGNVAVGENVDATGINSTAVGAIADANGSESTALGHDANATAPSTTAIGKSAVANASRSTAIGANSSASGADSTALGQTSSAAGGGSTALGAQATTTMANSTAVGGAASAIGSDSTAVGLTASAIDGSTALGSVAVASGAISTAIGQSTLAAATGSTAIGQDADVDINSNDAVALGHDAKVVNASGSIAIGSDIDSDGTGATATDDSAIAIGADSEATKLETIAVGFEAIADGIQSTVIGAKASAPSTSTGTTVLGMGAEAGFNSVAVGRGISSLSAVSVVVGESASSSNLADRLVAIGQGSSVNGSASISIGQSSTIDSLSTDAVALGHEAVVTNAIGGIAIGGDVDNDGTGATATAEGAIAIGADVVADKANTMTVGVPIEVVRDDGSSNILIEESNATVAVRTLGELANNGGVRLRFNNMALGEEWDFTSNQTGGFQFSLVGSGGAELSVGTNGTVRMGPGPISNLTLFPSGNMTIEGVLTENSDRNSKQQITELDHESILDKVSALSIHEWEYKDSPDQRHIGPMAQDFHEAFNLGNDNTHIATLDMAGVALAAIQAIKQEKDEQIQELKRQNNELIDRLERIEAQLTSQ